MEKIHKIRKIISELPDAPGVYLFKRGKEILYIGKATSLKDRVRSYFSADIVTTRGPLISKMLLEFDNISYEKTDSVLEALILEAHLIKKYQPPANVKEKDNRSFNYLIITDEDFPRVLVMRGKELEKFFSPHSSKSTDIFLLKNSSCSAQPASQGFFQNDGSKIFSIKKFFGPFPNGGQLKEALKIVRKMFPFRDKCIPVSEQQNKPLVPRSFSGVGCFNRQIGLCPGVCTGEISKEDYAKTIKNIILFFETDKKKLIKNLESQMKSLAKARKFEQAQKIKNTIFTLNHIQDISLIKENFKPTDNIFRIESYDIAHLSGQNMVGVMTVVENGEKKLSDYRKFKIRGNIGPDDTKALAEVLTRRLGHIEWPLPDLIVVDGGRPQKNVIEKILRTNVLKIPTVSVVKDERHKPKDILVDQVNKQLKTTHEREILLANAEAHRFAIGFHRKLRQRF